jgi:hypothetical protein
MALSENRVAPKFHGSLLVGALEHFIFFDELGIIIPFD